MLKGSIETVKSYSIDLGDGSPLMMRNLHFAEEDSDRGNDLRGVVSSSDDDDAVDGVKSESCDGDEGSRVGTGILIVPSGRGSDAQRNRGNLHRAATNLSVPGTASLPTDIGSLRDPMAASLNNIGSRYGPESEMGTLSFEEAVRRVQQLGSGRNNKIGAVLLFSITLMSLATSCYLVWERSAMQDMTKRQEELLRQIQEKLEAQSKLVVKQPDPEPLHPNYECLSDRVRGVGECEHRVSFFDSRDMCECLSDRVREVGECEHPVSFLDSRDICAPKVEQQEQCGDDEVGKGREKVLNRWEVALLKARENWSAGPHRRGKRKFGSGNCDSGDYLESQNPNVNLSEIATNVFSGVAYAALGVVVAEGANRLFGGAGNGIRF